MADRDFRPSDPILGRAVDALRELPAVDREAVARTLAAAGRLRSDDTGPNEDDLVSAPPAGWSRRWLVAGAAAAVVLGAGVALIASHSRPATPVAAYQAAPATRAPAVAPVIAAAASPDIMDNAPVPTQFVYDGRAGHVALVGDFNGWDERATPLEREPGSALWSVTVPLQRGRHVYAFIVDSTWTTDRRAPLSRDPDFGVEGSVIIVGRP